MKIFNLLKKHCANIGLNRPDSFDEFNRLNLINSANLVGLCVSSILIGVFFFFNSKTVSDFLGSFLGFSASSFIFYMFGIAIWKTQSIHKIIEHFEKIIQSRKSQESNEAIAKLNKMH